MLNEDISYVCKIELNHGMCPTYIYGAWRRPLLTKGLQLIRAN